MKETTNSPDGFLELAREIRELIRENRRFLEKVMEEDFEPEEEEAPADSLEDFEEL